MSRPAHSASSQALRLLLGSGVSTSRSIESLRGGKGVGKVSLQAGSILVDAEAR